LSFLTWLDAVSADLWPFVSSKFLAQIAIEFHRFPSSYRSDSDLTANSGVIGVTFLDMNRVAIFAIPLNSPGRMLQIPMPQVADVAEHCSP
jgi:hypothetical protein